MTKAKILVVDDNDGIRSALSILLKRHFAEVELIASPKQLRSTILAFKPDVVLLDMNFYTDINTGNEGLFCLSEIKRYAPTVEVVLFTAYADIQLAVEGMKRGAFDFVVKPWDNEHLVETSFCRGGANCFAQTVAFYNTCFQARCCLARYELLYRYQYW